MIVTATTTSSSSSSTSATNKKPLTENEIWFKTSSQPIHNRTPNLTIKRRLNPTPYAEGYEFDDPFDFAAGEDRERTRGKFRQSFVDESTLKGGRGRRLADENAVHSVTNLHRLRKSGEQKIKLKLAQKQARKVKKGEKRDMEKVEIDRLQLMVENVQAETAKVKREYNRRWEEGLYCWCQVDRDDDEDLVPCKDPLPNCPGRGFYHSDHFGRVLGSKLMTCLFCEQHADQWVTNLAGDDDQGYRGMIRAPKRQKKARENKSSKPKASASKSSKPKASVSKSSKPKL